MRRRVLKAAISTLDACGTQAEWNAILAGILRYSLGVLGPRARAESDAAPEPSAILARELVGIVQRGFRPKPHRPKRQLQALQDASDIAYGRYRDARTISECARLMASREDMTVDAARMRIARARRLHPDLTSGLVAASRWGERKGRASVR